MAASRLYLRYLNGEGKCPGYKVFVYEEPVRGGGVMFWVFRRLYEQLGISAALSRWWSRVQRVRLDADLALRIGVDLDTDIVAGRALHVEGRQRGGLAR